MPTTDEGVSELLQFFSTLYNFTTNLLALADYRQ